MSQKCDHDFRGKLNRVNGDQEIFCLKCYEYLRVVQLQDTIASLQQKLADSREALVAITVGAPESEPERCESSNYDDHFSYGMEFQHFHSAQVARKVLAVVQTNKSEQGDKADAITLRLADARRLAFEECAKICDQETRFNEGPMIGDAIARNTAKRIAAAIRERGAK